MPNVTGVWRGKWPETMRVQIRKSHRGHAQQVAAALWGCHLGNYAAKHLIVVDDDIDIHDWEAIEWALCYRVNAGLGRCLHVSPAPAARCSIPACRRRSAIRSNTAMGNGPACLIDATINWQLQPQEQYGGNRYPPVGTAISDGDGRAAEKEMERIWILES